MRFIISLCLFLASISGNLNHSFAEPLDLEPNLTEKNLEPDLTNQRRFSIVLEGLQEYASNFKPILGPSLSPYATRMAYYTSIIVSFLSSPGSLLGLLLEMNNTHWHLRVTDQIVCDPKPNHQLITKLLSRQPGLQLHIIDIARALKAGLEQDKSDLCSEFVATVANNDGSSGHQYLIRYWKMAEPTIDCILNKFHDSLIYSTLHLLKNQTNQPSKNLLFSSGKIFGYSIGVLSGFITLSQAPLTLQNILPQAFKLIRFCAPI